MAKCFSKKYGIKGSTTCNPKVMPRCLSAPDAISLHHCIKNKQLIREYGSTLYVGLARDVSPTNTNFRLTFLLTRLQEALYEDLAE